MDEARHQPDAGVMPPDWLSEGWPHIWLPYTQMQTSPLPLPIIGAEGARLRLADGRQLIDGIASWWSVAHGYNHPHIRQAVARQLEVLPHVMLGGLAHEQAFRLAKRLSDLLPCGLSRVFFTDSGSVAVEVAMKMAIQYWLNRGEPGKHRIVGFKGAYHGDTFATMAVCDPDEGMHAKFRNVLSPQIILPLPVNASSAEICEKELNRNRGKVAAVILEPIVQGAGGMIFHDATIVENVASLARRHNALLILDEIFTGFARTGRMFAFEHSTIAPDIICLGKALTGGTLPLAATVATSEVFGAFLSDDATHALMHGPTFMGNALACAAANASIDLFEQQPRLVQVAQIETDLRLALEPAKSLPGVRDVRVKGAIGVIEMDRLDRQAMRTAFLQRGVWLRPFGNIIYTTPPLTITRDELRCLTASMLEVVADTKSRA